MKTIKNYSVNFMRYGEITVPAGTPVTHHTACGFDPNYHFVDSFEWVKDKYPEIANLLIWDLDNHGLNIPAEFVEEKDKESQSEKENIIQKSERLTGLIKEFQESKDFESCTHLINPDHARNGYFFLIDKRNSEVLKHGTPSEIKSYMNLHGIRPEFTYKYSYIDHKFIKLIE